MWPNARPPSRTSPGDHYNNNSAGNPYSRNATAQKVKPGRQSTDPWDWGWEDNSAQQDDWNNGWNQAPTPNPPNVIPNPAPHFYSSKPEKSTRGTPDLIPDKINNVSRGNMMQPQQPYSQISNASDFFENIDLGRQNHQPPPVPHMYSSPDPRRPPQSSVPPSYPMFQPTQSTINRHPTPANYFRQPNTHPSNSEPLPYYQQPPQSHNTGQAFQNSQYYQAEPNNQILTQDYSSNYFNKSQPLTSNNYYEQNSFVTSNDVSYQPSPSANPVEVENIEVPIASSERVVTPALNTDSLRDNTPQNSQEINQTTNLVSADETNIPDNQETVPDEEHLQNLPQKLNQMKITSSYNLETWNSSSGWENQEVAPRCELDRNQYLETGQLADSSGAEEIPQETDNNDEGEALPPPGLHRLVTGQGTESISQRSVLGQLPSVPQNTSSGFVRLVPGQPTPSASPEPTNLERMVLGQQNMEDIPRNSQRMVPGQQNNEEIPRNSQRMVPGQQHDEDIPRNSQRMVPGQQINEEISRNSQRMVPGQQSNEEVPLGAQRRVSGQQNSEEILMNSRVVPGQQKIEDSSMNSQRMVLGQQNSEEEIQINSSVRMVPGQQNNEDIVMNSSQRMVPGHQQQDSQLTQNFSTHQELQADFQRLVPGQIQNELPLGARMIPGQLSDDESNVNTNDMERMIPGGVSEHENSFPGDGPDDERMVPGGMSDDSRSQSISMDDDAQNSSERMIPGMTMPAEMAPPQQDSQTERLVTGRGSTDLTANSQDGGRHAVNQRNGVIDSTSQVRPGLQRLVLGQMNLEVSNDKDSTIAKVGERVEETQGVNPPPVMHRMVVGQFREKEGEPEIDKEKETIKSNERDDDSDSDYRSDRRRHRHRKDNYEDERKERDYSSEREFRGSRREDRRDYRKKRDSSYNRSPEYRSDHEEYERNDYRDRRERERRDRPKDRDRRRRSPDYSYRDDPYYREDPRKLPHRERDRRYYDFEEDPYYYRENRSRPSSRSGSEYRRHRDYPPRQQYYPDQGVGMGNYMHYYQLQQYYENMRRNDPQAYAQWYERYMAEKFGTASNDRASVHSGRSSANENSQLNETEEEEREGVKTDDVASHRSTPPLYSSAHIRGQFNNMGQLVIVNPHDPFSYGEHHGTVTVCKVAGPNAADNPDTLEFLQNPGPFISGVTHKNTVLQYLKKHSDQSSHSSEKLLYELIRLVIKLNGVVDMIDVADLLMESYRNNGSERDNFDEMIPEVDESPPLSPHQVTSKFRDLLLEGNKTEALEWAMKNKDWGHALFLASKMDSRTHNNVMLRFANGLQNNDPLQTLYQLMSGHEPQAATCAADKKWGDWRPHLAMMLSNRTSNIELDRKAILTLGDSLAGRSRLFAAHFCYLTAQLEFSNYSDHLAKMVLLGASPDRPFSVFASCRAIMLTLCYEYAKQLSMKEWCIPTLRPYKFLLACRLFDHGNLSAALAYLEALAQDIVRLPRREDKPLVQLIVDMADKIKCADNTLSFTSDPANDPEWLSRLKLHIEETNDPNYLSAHMTHGVSTSTVSDLEPISGVEHVPQPVVQDNNQIYPQEINPYQAETHFSTYNSQEPYYDPAQNNYYNPSQPIQNSQEIQQNTGYITDQQYTQVDSSSNSYWSPNSNNSWSQQANNIVQEEQSVESAPADLQPQISVKPGFGYFANSEENIKPQGEQQTAPPSEKPEIKEKSIRRANKAQQSGSGWFGGIWDKLALRPKNQMKLPDDKNPSIVWDEKTKKWMNKDASEDEQNAQLKPPPKASELNGSALPAAPLPVPSPIHPMTGDSNGTLGGPVNNSGLPPPAPSAPSINKYKLQRGKGMRGNYVDVLGSNKTASGSSTTNSQPFTTMPQAPVTNFFVPAPIPGNENAPVDFLSPSGPVSYELSASKSDDQPIPGGGLPNAKSGTLKLVDFGTERVN